MKSLVSQVGFTALLLAGFTVLPIYSHAQETAAPVPTRSDENDPNSEVYRASDIMGLTIKDDQGQEIGKIKDLVINGASREVLYAVVGMNDAKEKDTVYVMPWTVFQPTFGQGQAIQYTVLTVPRNIWMQAPYWTAAQWRQAPYSQWSGRVNQYFETHIHTNTANNSKSTTVRTNKPVLKNDKHDGDKDAPQKDKPAAQPNKDDRPQPKADSNKPKEEPKPKLNPAPKPNPEPKAAEKPKLKEAEIPAAKGPQLPAPKNPDPAGPESPKRPQPQEPKVPTPNPK